MESRLTLHVDPPFLFLETERLESPLLTQSLRLVNELVTTIIPCSRVTFRIFICEGQVRLLVIKHEKGEKSILCMTLPKASRTAWDVKFSDGIKLIKCFCRLFSYGRYG